MNRFSQDSLFDRLASTDSLGLELMPLLAALGPEGYAPGMSERVYATLAERAALILREGHSVIVDAVYARENEREAIESVAREASAPFAGLWLEARASVLIATTEQRKNDPSDVEDRIFRRESPEVRRSLKVNRQRG